MKNIILILSLFISAISFSQEKYSVPVQISQGFKFKDYHNPQLYMVSTSVKPSIVFLNSKLKTTAIVQTTFSDGVTDVLSGPGISYKVYENPSFNIQLGATALYGSNNRQLYGGDLTVEFESLFFLNVNIAQEYSNKELWFSGGVGLNVFKAE